MFKQLNKKFKSKKLNVCVIGLGYVGLPLAEAFSKHFKVFGFDISQKRIMQLRKNYDSNQIVNKKKKFQKNLIFTKNSKDISDCDIFIITVPTPVNKKNEPDLFYLNQAINNLIQVNLKNKFIIIESTIFPTLCNEYIKKIEKKTNLKMNKDFCFGYSPERINPGDNIKTLKSIDKIVSCPSIIGLRFLNMFYKKIVNKTHTCSVLAEAEMAKIIENTQRDINISFINEITIVCNKLNLNFSNVLKLASTKWNFLKFTPGLVGGHCISVDPYYLTYILKKKKYNPKVILSGRQVNEGYPNEIYNIISKKITKKTKNILIAGLAYKEDCNDIRNSKSINLGRIFKNKGYNVNFFDPHVQLRKINNIPVVKSLKNNFYDVIVICVRHSIFFNSLNKCKFYKFTKSDSLIYDVKRGIFC
jgi:UDP-N-acetyl-D-galactosamine dehydrogenase